MPVAVSGPAPKSILPPNMPAITTLPAESTVTLYAWPCCPPSFVVGKPLLQVGAQVGPPLVLEEDEDDEALEEDEALDDDALDDDEEELEDEELEDTSPIPPVPVPPVLALLDAAPPCPPQEQAP